MRLKGHFEVGVVDHGMDNWFIRHEVIFSAVKWKNGKGSLDEIVLTPHKHLDRCHTATSHTHCHAI